MKRLVFILLAILGFMTAANANVYILTKGTPYTNNTIIKGGVNKPFPMEEFKRALQNGKRLIAVGYTNLEGWVLSMADNTGIRLQHITLSPEWPQEWIEEEWANSFMVSAIGNGGDQWCVISSLNCGLSQQVCKTGKWEEDIRMFISEQWNSFSRRITSICSTGRNNWAVVMSIDEKLSGLQRYDFKTSWPAMSNIINTYWSNDFYINNLTYGAKNVCVVFNQGHNETTPKQEYTTDPLTVQELIDKGYVVTQIGNHM